MSFVDELRNEAKTPEEAADAERTISYLRAERAFESIKKTLIKEVNSGHYEITESGKLATCYYKVDTWHVSINYNFAVGMKKGDVMIYADPSICEEYVNKYNCFMEKLQELCAQEKIQATPVMYHPFDKIEYTFPGRIWGGDFHSKKTMICLHVKCQVEF